MKSWAERSRIWNLGGLGWRDEGDESKIVWTCPEKQRTVTLESWENREIMFKKLREPLYLS